MAKPLNTLEKAGLAVSDENMCDDYQREAVQQCSGFKAAFKWNRYAEYPRLSWRFPLQQYQSAGVLKKWAISTLCLDSIAEQMHSQSIYVLSLCWSFLFFAFFIGIWWDFNEDMAPGGIYFDATMYVIIVTAVAIVFFWPPSFLRKGLSTKLPKGYIWIQPLVWAVLFTVMVFTVWDDDCPANNCQTVMPVNITQLGNFFADDAASDSWYDMFWYRMRQAWVIEISVLFFAIVIVQMLVAFGCRIPTPLLRRNYNVKYVRELLSPERRRKEGNHEMTAWDMRVLAMRLSDVSEGSAGLSEQARVKGLQTISEMVINDDDTELAEAERKEFEENWTESVLHRQYHSPDGKQFSTVSGYAAHLESMGYSPVEVESVISQRYEASLYNVRCHANTISDQKNLDESFRGWTRYFRCLYPPVAIHMLWPQSRSSNPHAPHTCKTYGVDILMLPVRVRATLLFLLLFFLAISFSLLGSAPQLEEAIDYYLTQLASKVDLFNEAVDETCGSSSDSGISELSSFCGTNVTAYDLLCNSSYITEALSIDPSLKPMYSEVYSMTVSSALDDLCSDSALSTEASIETICEAETLKPVALGNTTTVVSLVCNDTSLTSKLNATNIVNISSVCSNALSMCSSADWVEGFISPYTALVNDPKGAARTAKQGLVFATIMATIICLINLHGTVLGYKEILFDLRAQKQVHFAYSPKLVTPYYVTNFMIAATGFMFLSYSLIVIILLAIWFIVGFHPVWELVDETFYSLLIAYILSKVWATGIIKKAIYDKFLQDPENGAVLKHPNYFLAIEFAVIGSQLVEGVSKSIEQLLFSVIGVLTSLMRPDRSRLPRGMEPYDAAFSGVLAAMLMFEQHCSPCVTEFLDGICVPDPLNGIKNLRRLVDSGQTQYTEKLVAAERAWEKKKAVMMQLGDDEGFLTDFKDIGNTMRLSVQNLTNKGNAESDDDPDSLHEGRAAAAMDEPLTEEDVAALRPFYVARNRWHFALTMLKNPSLMKYRSWRLPKPLKEEEHHLPCVGKKHEPEDESLTINEGRQVHENPLNEPGKKGSIELIEVVEVGEPVKEKIIAGEGGTYPNLKTKAEGSDDIGKKKKKKKGPKVTIVDV